MRKVTSFACAVLPVLALAAPAFAQDKVGVASCDLVREQPLYRRAQLRQTSRSAVSTRIERDLECSRGVSRVSSRRLEVSDEPLPH